MPRLLFVTCSTTLLISAAAIANSPDDVRLLTPACEEALALSALPARLREDASAYVMTERGFELTRKGDGPFTCIVERNHANALVPQCPDAAGLDSVIPGIIKKSEWALQGVPSEERRNRFEALAERGDLKAPSRPGISYMMSPFNLIWSEPQGELTLIPPHVMFYAPNLSNEDIGGSMRIGLGEDGNRGYPFVVDESIHGYVSTLVDKGSDPAAVFAACKGQVAAIDELRAAAPPQGDR